MGALFIERRFSKCAALQTDRDNASAFEGQRDIDVKYILLAAGMLAATTAQAAEFDLTWTGSDGYSMTGSFGFDNALLGAGAIDETDIDFLTIEVFDNGASLGVTTGVAGDGFAGMGPEFNFNFDTTTLSFAQGGRSDEPGGQAWNFEGPGVGFASGSRFQLVTLNGASISESAIGVNMPALEASVSEVPLPGALGLLLAGLGVFSAFRLSGRRA